MRQRLLSTIGFPASVAPETANARRVDRRSLVWALIVVAAVAIAAAGGSMAGTSTHPRSVIGPSASHSQAHLSTAANLAVSRGLGADLPGYRLARSSDGFLAHNARQGLTASFGDRGATVSTRAGAHASIALQAIGSGSALRAAGLARPLAHGNRVEYRRSGATEWFANGPAGLEQGFAISKAPADARGGELTLALGLSGTLSARPGTTGGLVLADSKGLPMLRYGDLSVTDASGNPLPAHMTVEHGRILISVDARGARYPLTVDPLLNQVAELYASDGAKEDELGTSIAYSSGIIVVGEPLGEVSGHYKAGAAYVYTEGTHGWENAQQTAKLIASNPEDEEALGAAVAISGRTIVLGAPGRKVGGSAEAGGAYVYSEPAKGWGETPEQTQAAELINSEDVPLYSFGASVAVDGETIVVGAPFYRDYTQNLAAAADGAAFIFQEPAGGWASEPNKPESQTAILAPIEKDVEGQGRFGLSIAMSSDGSEQTVAVGAPEEPVGSEVDKYRRGSVFIFSRPAGGWKREERFPEARLTANNAEFAELGQSVSLSGDVLVAGAPEAEAASSEQGAAFVFTAPPDGWTSNPEQTAAAELTNSVGTKGEQFGDSVAVEGSTIAVGGALKNGYLFAMPSSGWSGEIHPAYEFAGKIDSVGLAGGNGLMGAIEASPPGGTGALYQGAVDVVPFAPEANTGGTSGLTEVTATIEGTVNPDQTEVTSCKIQYGTSTVYSQEVPCSTFPKTGAATSPVSAEITGLSSGTTYHYRVVASNSVDTSYGTDATFTTTTAASSGGGSESPGTTIGTTVTGTTPAPTTSTGVTSTSGGGTSVSVASSPKAVEELLHGCSSSPLVLNDVYIQGSHVFLSGSAAKSLVGKKVKILFNEGKPVATATVKTDGQYTATAPLPPAKIRDNLDTRYTAEIGKQRSLHLKLVRRLLLEPPKASGTTVTLTGQLTLPLTKPIAPVTVEQQLECGKTTIAKTFTPAANGRFHITITVPPNAKAAIFRLTSKVAANKHSVTHGFTTFSLPLPIAIG